MGLIFAHVLEIVYYGMYVNVLITFCKVNLRCVLRAKLLPECCGEFECLLVRCYAVAMVFEMDVRALLGCC